jgi:hypothetical protein
MASFFGNVAGTNKRTQQSTFMMTSINGSVVVDGVTYVGKRIRLMNDKVFVDDKEVGGLGTDPKRPVNVVIKERVESIEGDFNTITAKDVGSIKSSMGDVKVKGNVTGNVSTQSGDVTVKGSVDGSVNSMSGSIDVGGPVHGSATSMSGSVKCVKK